MSDFFKTMNFSLANFVFRCQAQTQMKRNLTSKHKLMSKINFIKPDVLCVSVPTKDAAANNENPTNESQNNL